jgi:CheY-like chemotaxis protein
MLVAANAPLGANALASPLLNTLRRSTINKETKTKMKAIPSILVVEDNPVALKTLASLLRALGAQTVTEASSAEQALDIVAKQKFTFILTDYRLEGMNGVQFLEKLRAGGDQTPVIVLSGSPDKTGVMRAASYNRVDFFGKPFRMEELSGAIDRLVAAA